MRETEQKSEITPEEDRRSRGRIGTILLQEIVNSTNTKSDILHSIPEVEGFYKVFVQEEDIAKIKLGEHKTVNGMPFCPVAGDKKNYLRNSTELQTVFDSNASEILYVGKADNLRRRITQLINMAFGGTGHRGGIDLWAVTALLVSRLYLADEKFRVHYSTF